MTSKLRTWALRTTLLAALLTTSFTTAACTEENATPAVKVTVKHKTVTKTNTDDLDQAKKLETANKKERKRLDALAKDIAATKSSVPKADKKKVAAKTQNNTTQLANLTYSGTQEITVNSNDPAFSKTDLSTAKGAWESYGNLDNQNRVTAANALLGQSLMPTSERTGLTYDPTGWHNKRTAHGWLYNRSHLIGFQLSGENNNPKNLMTGTMSLNNPLMLVHEDDIAAYLKESKQHYVRYQVTPIFRGNELVARGVQLRAQSVGDSQIRFNVYIFNVEAGYKIDYSTGYSQKN